MWPRTRWANETARRIRCAREAAAAWNEGPRGRVYRVGSGTCSDGHGRQRQRCRSGRATMLGQEDDVFVDALLLGHGAGRGACRATRRSACVARGRPQIAPALAGGEQDDSDAMARSARNSQGRGRHLMRLCRPLHVGLPVCPPRSRPSHYLSRRNWAAPAPHRWGCGVQGHGQLEPSRATLGATVMSALS